LSAQAFDVHQHLWPDSLLSALARRRTPPRLRRNVLELGNEGSFEVDLAAHDLQTRLRELDRDEIDVAIVSLAPTLGIELLPADEAEALLDAYHEGITDVARQSHGRIRAFAAARVMDGFAGTTVAADALGDVDGLSPLLTELSDRGGVLFVHPGPSDPPPGAPGWWGAVVGYTAQMQAAYAAWLSRGVRRWPDLPVVFAILAGGGPFQLERLRSRGVDPGPMMRSNLYLETASYGPHALALCIDAVGVGRLLYGSDAPVIDAQPTLRAVRELGQEVADALCRANPSALFSPP
jgi:predicted TIM-barrel fold metal-dependent hydrolase